MQVFAWQVLHEVAVVLLRHLFWHCAEPLLVLQMVCKNYNCILGHQKIFLPSHSISGRYASGVNSMLKALIQLRWSVRLRYVIILRMVNSNKYFTFCSYSWGGSDLCSVAQPFFGIHSVTEWRSANFYSNVYIMVHHKLFLRYHAPWEVAVYPNLACPSIAVVEGVRPTSFDFKE